MLSYSERQPSADLLLLAKCSMITVTVSDLIELAEDYKPHIKKSSICRVCGKAFISIINAEAEEYHFLNYLIYLRIEGMNDVYFRRCRYMAVYKERLFCRTKLSILESRKCRSKRWMT